MKILLKVFSFKFQSFNGVISFNDEQPLNILPKLVPFDTFQFFNGVISFNDEQFQNIKLKFVQYFTFNYFNSSIFFKFLHE